MSLFAIKIDDFADRAESLCASDYIAAAEAPQNFAIYARNMFT